MMRAMWAGIALVAAAAGCTHPSTPEGHEGYVYHVPLMFGKAEFRETLRGPASTGVSWRLYVENIDMRTKSYTEEFQLLTRDNLSVDFEVNTRISLRPGSSREIVEQWGGEQWYAWNVKEPLRTIVRTTVTGVSAVDIQIKTEQVRTAIEQRLVDKYKDTPIKIESVDIGNIRFPKEVMAAIERKIGTEQELERQEYVLEKTRKEAAIRVLNALKEAEQQQIISETLNPLYVQRLAVDVYGKIAASNNHTVVVLPNADNGTGMPLVLAEGRRKPLTAADKQMLEEMERRYMEIARRSGEAADARPGALPAKAADPDAPARPDARPAAPPAKAAQPDAPAQPQ